jgi:hypothetical protein
LGLAAVTQSTTAAFIGMIASSVVLILSLMKQGDIANIANPGPSKHQINAVSLLTQTLTTGDSVYRDWFCDSNL